MRGPLGRLTEGRLIVGMNSLDEFFGSGQTIPWIKTQNAVAFLRPMPDVGVGTPGPTARMAEPLRFGQIGFAPAQCLLGLFPLGHIHHGSHQSHHGSGLVSDWLRNGFDVLPYAVWQNENIFQRPRFTGFEALPQRAINAFTVFRPYPRPEFAVMGRRGRIWESEDLAGFNRPIGIGSLVIHDPTSSFREPLTCREMPLTTS